MENWIITPTQQIPGNTGTDLTREDLDLLS